jgi:hypothetical protein
MASPPCHRLTTNPTPLSTLSFLILGQRVHVACSDPTLLAVLDANFGAMMSPHVDSPPDLEYSISGGPTAYSLSPREKATIEAENPGDLLYLLEAEVTVDLQKRRPDLFFLHSAALVRDGKAYLFTAESGGGKSTTTWGLLHHGFGYLSDELSPIDLHSMSVLPYPHALCLKRSPPAPYSLPSEAIYLGRTIHIPTRVFPSDVIGEPIPLAAVFLLNYSPHLAEPNVGLIGPGEASAHLYVAALNALAHPNQGLDAVVSIAKRVPTYAVNTADLRATCALIRSVIEQAAHE